MKQSKNKLSSAVSSFFRDKDGNVVLMQWPNIPLVIWFVGMVISKVTSGNLQEFASFVSFGALLVWAVMEIFSGVNYFRRTLGVVVMIFTIYSRLAS